MPNIKSAKKRVVVNEKNKAINKSYKSELATGLKKYNAAVKAGDVEAVKALLPVTVSLVDESVTRGIIHKNKYNKPANTYDITIRKNLASIYRKEYKGTNFTEFAKIMQEERGFEQSRSTIYNILREQRIRSPQRKKTKRKVSNDK